METNVPQIDVIIPIIVSIASPDQIILFGSYVHPKFNLLALKSTPSDITRTCH